MITATLQRAWTDISGFLVVITIMFMAYSITVCRFPHNTQHAICFRECWANSDEMSTFQTNLMYGWKLYSYRTLLDAAQTMISLQLGIFNYEEVSVIINDPKLSTWALYSLANGFVWYPCYISGSQLQSGAWRLSHWLLHCVHDLRGVEPLYFGHPGGIQSGANISQGNSHIHIPKGPVCGISKASRAWHWYVRVFQLHKVTKCKYVSCFHVIFNGKDLWSSPLVSISWLYIDVTVCYLTDEIIK